MTNVISQTRKAPPVAMVIFGASGDLTSRKLLPAIANLAKEGALDERFILIGVARTPLNDDSFRDLIKKATEANQNKTLDTIIQNARYISGDYAKSETFDALKKILDETQALHHNNKLFYLATVPEVFIEVACALKANNLNTEDKDTFTRIVIEKPFGRNYETAQQLDKSLHDCFLESQIYRIDHYMGKETVQNVLALRFANAVFEPVWNRRYVDNIQVTVAESIGVEHRGTFYETEGALRDIVQNHVMQVLAITLMEPPPVVDAQGIRDEKVKLLKSIKIFSPDEIANKVVRGQYTAGQIDGQEVPSYRDEPGVSKDSKTETYLAMELEVDNFRWAGVPIYVRTGKRLKRRVTDVVLTFQKVPHLPFSPTFSRGLRQDRLVLRIQPDESITLHFGAKVPGPEFKLQDVTMNFSYKEEFKTTPKDAYERLILDALMGDPTLFIRTDEVQQAWKIVDPVLNGFQEDLIPLAFYQAGTWGPKEADRLLRASQRGDWFVS
jgi:glucose-6-phosphate 1-dehydrogenase